MPYFTTDELRDLPDLADSGRFPDSRLEAAHDWIVSIIERECDTSFVPTVVTRTFTGTGRGEILLPTIYVRSVDSATVDGVALTGDQLGTLTVDRGSVFWPAGGRWSNAARNNVSITYTAGYSETPPPDLKEAALRAARNWLLTSDAWSGKDSRATAITNDYGNIALSVAGPDRPTGLPDVDATIMAWAERTRIPGFA